MHCLYSDKASRKEFRRNFIEAHGFELTEAHRLGLKHVEGEGDDYQPGRRVMTELAAFCHTIDLMSARVWHDKPDPANRIRARLRLDATLDTDKQE
jgi:hypothetical protein